MNSNINSYANLTTNQNIETRQNIDLKCLVTIIAWSESKHALRTMNHWLVGWNEAFRTNI